MLLSRCVGLRTTLGAPRLRVLPLASLAPPALLAPKVRTVKLTSSGGVDRTSLYVLPGDMERRGVEVDRDVMNGDAWRPVAGVNAETQYLVGGARVVWKHDMPMGGGGTGFETDVRITVPLQDLLQTTVATMDLVSGELLEVGTFYPSGNRETLRARDSSVDGQTFQLEPMGFTGKEGDDDVGVVYFGERYLLPHVGRWASADPLEIHQPSQGGEFGNAYHYVSGNLLQSRDPIGLCTDQYDPTCHEVLGVLDAVARFGYSDQAVDQARMAIARHYEDRGRARVDHYYLDLITLHVDAYNYWKQHEGAEAAAHAAVNLTIALELVYLRDAMVRPEPAALAALVDGTATDEQRAQVVSGITVRVARPVRRGNRWVDMDVADWRRNAERRVAAGDLSGAPRVPGGRPGHPFAKISDRDRIADVLSEPERIFTGTNRNGRRVDVYFQGGDAVVTVQGDKTKIITAFGASQNRHAPGTRVRPADPGRWADQDRWAGGESYAEAEFTPHTTFTAASRQEFEADEP